MMKVSGGTWVRLCSHHVETPVTSLKLLPLSRFCKDGNLPGVRRSDQVLEFILNMYN
jgi:hypothetical protein